MERKMPQLVDCILNKLFASLLSFLAAVSQTDTYKKHLMYLCKIIQFSLAHLQCTQNAFCRVSPKYIYRYFGLCLKQFFGAWGEGFKMEAAFLVPLFSCPSLLLSVTLFCISSLLRHMLRPFYPCLWPLQILPFAAALCNLTLLNFILYHVFTSESQVLIWTTSQCHLQMETSRGMGETH